MRGWFMSTQSHLMKSIFCWFSHGLSFFSWFLGTTPESYLKPWEEIQHSQDLKIESANKFQHGLWSLFSNQNPPIHALCSKIFFKHMTFLAWSHIIPCIKWQSGIILYSPLIKGSAAFNWNESKVIFKETAVQSSFRGKGTYEPMEEGQYYFRMEPFEYLF